ncbi:hypothetical protein E4U24_007315 [Claviceps purpurea]|nr:hypothetical protein E4U24_007315 [Claviceps purpurea]
MTPHAQTIILFLGCYHATGEAFRQTPGSRMPVWVGGRSRHLHSDRQADPKKGGALKNQDGVWKYASRILATASTLYPIWNWK